MKAALKPEKKNTLLGWGGGEGRRGLEINKTEIRKTIKNINEAKSWSFEKIGKINTLPARLTKKDRRCKLAILIRSFAFYSLCCPWSTEV